MRFFVTTFVIALTACLTSMSALLNADQPIIPVVELQSGPLMPGLVLDESPRPIHQIRLVVDASYRRGMLILDGSRPEFDEFGGLVGGIQTPEVRGTEESSLISQISCHIELVKDRSGTWRLYRVKSPELRTPLRIATRGSIDSGGPARIIVLGPDDSVKAVVECTRYGMVIP